MNSNIPELSTRRMCLRPFQVSDASEVQRLAGHPEVAATTASVPHPYPDGAAEQWISTHQDRAKNSAEYAWAMVDKVDGHLLGCISLISSKANNRAEIGYWVGVEFWGKGYCTEAAGAVVQYAFESLSLNKVTSRHLAMNPASGRVMQKIGMVQEGYLKEEMLLRGRYMDLVVYGLLRPR